MRLLPPLAVLAGAVLLLFLPGFVNGRRNDEGIAWVTPEGERVELAEAGYHVVLPGRDDHRAGPRHRRAPLAQDPPRCAELGIRAVAATATQVGWGRDVHAFASGDRNGAVVYDRRTGKQLLRHFGDKGVFLRSEASGS